MLEMIAKIYAAAKEMMVKEYGEQFTELTEEAKAAAVLKVVNDLVQANPSIAAAIAERYIEEAA